MQPLFHFLKATKSIFVCDNWCSSSIVTRSADRLHWVNTRAHHESCAFVRLCHKWRNKYACLPYVDRFTACCKPGTTWAIFVPTTAWGGGSDPTPPPCYLENKWSYRAPQGSIRKLSTRSSQSILKILWLTLSLGSRSGHRLNFDVSLWRGLGPAISIVFARNSAKVALKG